MIQGMSYQQLNWQMKERLTKRDQPSILYDASQSVFSGDGLISESVNEDVMPLERVEEVKTPLN